MADCGLADDDEIVWRFDPIGRVAVLADVNGGLAYRFARVLSAILIPVTPASIPPISGPVRRAAADETCTPTTRVPHPDPNRRRVVGPGRS